jgi:hypothetical protein
MNKPEKSTPRLGIKTDQKNENLVRKKNCRSAVF